MACSTASATTPTSSRAAPARSSTPVRTLSLFLCVVVCRVSCRVVRAARRRVRVDLQRVALPDGRRHRHQARAVHLTLRPSRHHRWRLWDEGEGLRVRTSEIHRLSLPAMPPSRQGIPSQRLPRGNRSSKSRATKRRRFCWSTRERSTSGCSQGGLRPDEAREDVMRVLGRHEIELAREPSTVPRGRSARPCAESLRWRQGASATERRPSLLDGTPAPADEAASGHRPMKR